MIYIKNGQTTFHIPFFITDSADHISGKTGLSPTVTISKNCAGFGSPSGAITEIGSGWYKLAGNASDSGTDGPLALHVASGASNDPADYLVAVVYSSSYGVPSDIVMNSALTLKKNTALTAFEFVMFDAGGNPKTGLTVTAQRSIDGAAFASCANAVAEVANGVYKITLAAADLNGNTVTLRFTATGAVATLIPIVLQP